MNETHPECHVDSQARTRLWASRPQRPQPSLAPREQAAAQTAVHRLLGLQRLGSPIQVNRSLCNPDVLCAQHSVHRAKEILNSTYSLRSIPAFTWLGRQDSSA